MGFVGVVPGTLKRPPIEELSSIKTEITIASFTAGGPKAVQGYLRLACNAVRASSTQTSWAMHQPLPLDGLHKMVPCWTQATTTLPGRKGIARWCPSEQRIYVLYKSNPVQFPLTTLVLSNQLIDRAIWCWHTAQKMWCLVRLWRSNLSAYYCSDWQWMSLQKVTL